MNESKANMFADLMFICETLTTEVWDGIKIIENSWVRQSNLIYLLNNDLASEKMKNNASEELARIQKNRTKQDGYVEIGYWDGGYSD